MISVNPQVTDLGECNVGEYRTAVFNVTNESDMPALVLPFVESETLAVMEREVHIPPRQTKAVKFEYVARLVNTEYKREAVLMNGYNSHGNLTVEIRAKNVDSHQVLLHSIFYKIHMGNRRKQLQVHFDKCLFNMPNLRTFTIRNISNEALLVEIKPSEPTDEIQIYLVMNEERRSTSPTRIKKIESRSEFLEDLKWGGSREAPAPSVLGVKGGPTVSFSIPDSDYRRKYSLGEAPTASGTLSQPAAVRSISTSISSSMLAMVENRADLPLSRGSDYPRDYSAVGEGVYEPFRSLTVAEPESAPGQDVDFIKMMDTPGFPFSTIEYLMDVPGDLRGNGNGNVATSSDPLREGGRGVGRTVDTKDEEEGRAVSAVRAIQKCYRDLARHKGLTGASKLVPLLSAERGGVMSVPRSKVAVFAVEFSPKSLDKPDELGQLSVTKELTLRLLQFSPKTDQMEDLNRDSSPGDAGHELRPLEVQGVPLRPRSIIMRAKATRSEMSITQKNINFGRMTVGDESTMGVTIVNKSSVPLIYDITKSGSISSRYLQIPTGRKGQVPPLQSFTIDLIFRPKLHGVFDETLEIANVLDPRNTINVVIKGRVIRPEYFMLLPALIPIAPKVTSSEPSLSGQEGNIEGSNKLTKTSDIWVRRGESEEDVDLESKIKSMLSAVSTVLPVSATSFKNVSLASYVATVTPGMTVEYLGEMAVGEPSNILLSFRIRNTTGKNRNFIVDASHTDAICLMATSMSGVEGGDEDYEAPFEPIPETMQSICTVRCQFQEIVAEAGADGGRMSAEDRKNLEDKLEHFTQKLKIAKRKKKHAKIVKYEKKVADAISLLTGSVTTGLEKNSVFVDGFKSVTQQQTSDSGTKRAVHGDSPTFLFQLGAEKESIIRVKVTLLPGPNYQHWVGPLPFRGSLRVLEVRNEDAVKHVHYCAAVYSSKRAYGNSTCGALEYDQPSLDSKLESDLVEERVVDTSNPWSTPVKERVRKYSETSSSTSFGGVNLRGLAEMRKLTITSDAANTNSDVVDKSEELDSNNNDFEQDESMEVEQCLFLTTVAQWSAFPTKEIMPFYKSSPFTILGMGIKLVPASKDRAMHGVLSVASLASSKCVLEIWLEEKFKSSDSIPEEYTVFSGAEFGPMTFAVGAKTDYSDQNKFASMINTTLSGDGTVDCTVQWQPSANVQAQHLLLGFIGVRLTADSEIGNTQYIPVVCYWEHPSMMKIEKSINFGEIPLGSTRDGTLTLTNLSETENLLYNARMLAGGHGGSRGVVSLSTISGEVEARGKRDIVLSVSGTSLGKFEQELLVQNVHDGFDQRRILVTATVTWPQTQFVQFVGMTHDAKGKLSK